MHLKHCWCAISKFREYLIKVSKKSSVLETNSTFLMERGYLQIGYLQIKSYLQILYLQIKSYLQIVAFQQKKKHIKGGGLLYGGYLQIGYLQIKSYLQILYLQIKSYLQIVAFQQKKNTLREEVYYMVVYYRVSPNNLIL